MDLGQIQKIGRYEILTRLSEGGFGEVYAACLRSTADFSTLVAIKVLHANLLSDGLTVKGFADEARIGGRLSHPNITRVLEFNQEGGRSYLVMELVDGVSFGHLVHHQRAHQDLDPSTLLEMIAQACDGLHFAHTLRDDSGLLFDLVHRDIKPSNLMLDRSGIVKVMDFGIAKARAEGRDPTLTGTLKGTPAYMAPEMARGVKAVDLRADLFALGAVLFELQTGRRLYSGSQLALIHQAASCDLSAQLAHLAETAPPQVAAIVERALAPDPEDRFASAAEMSRACRQAILELGVMPQVRELASELAPPPIRQGRSRSSDISAGDAARLTVLPWSLQGPQPGGASGAPPPTEGSRAGGWELDPSVPPTLGPWDLPQGQGIPNLAQAPAAAPVPRRIPPLAPLLGGLVIALAIILSIVLGVRRGPGAAQPGEGASGLSSEIPPVAAAPVALAPTPNPRPTPTPTPPPTAAPARPPAPSRVIPAPRIAAATPIPTASVSLTVNTAPEEQPLWIDGRRQQGYTPWTGQLRAGVHRIEVGEGRTGVQQITLGREAQTWLGIKDKDGKGWTFQSY